MSDLFQVGDIVTRRGDDLHRILQISSSGDSMLVECIRADKGVVVDDDGTLSDPCYKIGDQEWNLPRRYSYPEFMTIEGEAAHRQTYGITDAGKTRMLPTLRPATLQPYQEAFIREMLDSTSTKQVTVMKRADVGRTPLLFTAEELEIFGLSIETMPRHAVVVEDIWPPPVLPMVEHDLISKDG